uniref:Ovate family protein n=1 Tax=Elaeophora elaphi TaxID=1147741 RepID=A0A0R3RKP2_9BILA
MQDFALDNLRTLNFGIFLEDEGEEEEVVKRRSAMRPNSKSCEILIVLYSAFYREDEAKFLEKVAHLHLEDARAVSEIAEETKRKQRRHHSVQESPCAHHLPAIEDPDNSRSFSKSSSASFTKAAKIERRGMDFRNTKGDVGDKRISKWCGLLSSFSSAASSRQPSKKPQKRRMSTFT